MRGRASRPSPESRGQVLREFAALMEEYAGPGPTEEAARGFGHILNVLGSGPRSMAERLGERLVVSAQKTHADSTRIEWEYPVLGETSGEELARLSFAGTGEDVQDVDLSLVGLALQCALNGPLSTIAERDALSVARGGEGAWQCDQCERRFLTYAECELHEHDAHGVPLPPADF